MDFLDDAYRLGLLRTIGPAYQFATPTFMIIYFRPRGVPQTIVYETVATDHGPSAANSGDAAA
jgi:hypothetical protein